MSDHYESSQFAVSAHLLSDLISVSLDRNQISICFERKSFYDQKSETQPTEPLGASQDMVAMPVMPTRTQAFSQRGAHCSDCHTLLVDVYNEIYLKTNLYVLHDMTPKLILLPFIAIPIIPQSNAAHNKRSRELDETTKTSLIIIAIY